MVSLVDIYRKDYLTLQDYNIIKEKVNELLDEDWETLRKKFIKRYAVNPLSTFWALRRVGFSVLYSFKIAGGSQENIINKIPEKMKKWYEDFRSMHLDDVGMGFVVMRDAVIKMRSFKKEELAEKLNIPSFLIKERVLLLTNNLGYHYYTINSPDRGDTFKKRVDEYKIFFDFLKEVRPEGLADFIYESMKKGERFNIRGQGEVHLCDKVYDLSIRLAEKETPEIFDRIHQERIKEKAEEGLSDIFLKKGIKKIVKENIELPLEDILKKIDEKFYLGKRKEKIKNIPFKSDDRNLILSAYNYNDINHQNFSLRRIKKQYKEQLKNIKDSFMSVEDLGIFRKFIRYSKELYEANKKLNGEDSLDSIEKRVQEKGGRSSKQYLTMMYYVELGDACKSLEEPSPLERVKMKWQKIKSLLDNYTGDYQGLIQEISKFGLLDNATSNSKKEEILNSVLDYYIKTEGVKNENINKLFK